MSIIYRLNHEDRMRFTRPNHTHFTVIEGDKPAPEITSQFIVRLRKEQANNGVRKSLSTMEIDALKGRQHD